MNNVQRWMCGLLAGVVALAGVWSAQALEYNWKNTTGGVFATGANWVELAAPGASDNANFTSNNTYQVDWSANANNSDAKFNALGGTVTLNVGGGQTWTLTNDLNVGSVAGAAATVSQSSGTIDAKHVQVGFNGTANNNSLTIGAGAVMISRNTTAAGSLNLMIGGKNNTLTVSGGGKLYLEGMPVYGTAIASTSNRVIVTDSGSYMTVTNNTIGISGSGCELVVTNGADVYLQWHVGLAGDHNAVRVTGSGSTLRHGDAGNTADLGGNSNRFIVADGALCTNVGWLGAAGTIDSYYLIYGTGTVVTVGNDIYAYSADGSPSVIVSNGATLICGYAQARLGADSAGTKGAMIVTGPGTVFTNSAASPALSIGNPANSSGTLTVRDQATLYSAGANIGNGAGSTGLVIVADSGTVWQTTTDVKVGYGAGSRGTLIVTNGGLLRFKTLSFGGAGVTGSVLAVSGSGSHALINNAASTTPFILGNSGAQCALRVTDGGRFTGIGGPVYSSTYNGYTNTVLVSDTGSVFALTNNYFGIEGVGNQVIVTNGGRVDLSHSMGFGATANGNTVLVTGTGTVFNCPITYSMGISGISNRFVVTGGAVATNVAYIGATAQRGGGYIVSGPGSRIYATAELYVTDDGSSPSLMVTNGGWASSLAGRLAHGAASTGTVLVTGLGSVWTNSSYVRLGEAANTRATLTVADGGVVYGTDLQVGSGAGSTGTIRIVSGPAGLGRMTMTGTLTPLTNSTLEIALPTKIEAGVHTVMTYAARSRAFYPSEIICTNQFVTLTQSGTMITVTFAPPKGTVLGIR